MDGTAIRAEGRPDFGEVASLGERLTEIPSRAPRWLGSACSPGPRAGLAAALGSGRVGLRLLALSVAYLPLLLLLGAALRPGEAAELLLLALGAPALAASYAPALAGYRALAVACALTTLGLRDRRDRRLTADLALADRPQPRRRCSLLRDRQRAGGDPRPAWS